AISPQVQAEWAKVPGVDRADPISIAMSRISSGNRTASVAVFAVIPGSALAPDVAAGQVVLTTQAADALDVTAGDTIELAGKPVTVATVSGSDEFSHAPLVWASMGDRPETGQPAGVASVIALRTAAADLAHADQQLDTTTVTP